MNLRKVWDHSVSADVLFLFEIDHDNSIETGVLSHYVTATQEQSNILCSINHVDIIWYTGVLISSLYVV